MGVPVIFGPHMFHFEEVAALALESGAGRQVYDAAALTDAIAMYLGDAALRAAAGAAALRMVEANKGALEATLTLVARELRQLEFAAGRQALDDVIMPG